MRKKKTHALQMCATGIGWELGLVITDIPGYEENVRKPLRELLGIPKNGFKILND